MIASFNQVDQRLREWKISWSLERVTGGATFTLTAAFLVILVEFLHGFQRGKLFQSTVVHRAGFLPGPSLFNRRFGIKLLSNIPQEGRSVASHEENGSKLVDKPTSRLTQSACNRMLD
jgi:hypothetical protein